jgi:opacity protein-like surface antigen
MKNVLLLFCLFPFALPAQNLHLSTRIGMANYQGDLKAKSLSFKKSKLFLSLGAKYDLTEHLAARSYLSYTSLQADDKDGTASMQLRNLNFKSKILEWEAGAQYNLFTLNDRWWTPYVYAGIGLFRYKPYTSAPAGEKVFLQPLSTEGQGFVDGSKKYKLTQFFIPIGAGADYALSEDMRLGLEMGYRKLFTDYLDDVSNVYVDQAALLNAKGPMAVELAYRGDEVGAGLYPPENSIRGNPENKDGYFYVAVTFTMRAIFDTYKRIAGLPAYKRDKKVGCPGSRVR